MNLIERFVEVNDWSVSRKSVLLNSLALPVLIACVLLTALAPAESVAGIDRPLLLLILTVYASMALLSLLVSMVAVRRNVQGPWMATVTVMTQGPCLFLIIYGMGIWTSPFLALYPIATVMLALWFREASGWFTLIGGLLTLVAFGVLEFRGTLPHAPLLTGPEQSLSAAEVIGRMVPILIFFFYCFALCVLVLAARKRQDQRLREAQKLIRRYVPSQLADQIAAGGHDVTAKPERRNLTIFFSDVAGFTDASDELDPERLAALLNEYLSEMAQIADRHGATINQFVGDGIMIFFGAPLATDDRDHALRAVRMSLEMQQRMQQLQQSWFKRGFERPFRIRIGINTGYASVGDFGSQGRVVYSAIGLQTNLAARIQAQCEPGRVLISHTTWALVQESVACAAKGEIQVKGIHYPVRIYEVAAAA